MYFKPNFAILPFPAQNNYKAITLVPDGRRHLPLVKDSGGPELGDEGDGAPQSRGEFKVGSFSNHEKAPSDHARRLHSTLAIKLERFRKFSTKKNLTIPKRILLPLITDCLQHPIQSKAF
jgi:hypothetical protein